VWRARLDRSGIAAKYSGEAQPIVYGDTMYVVTGADDVFALEVETGEKRWVYQAELDRKIDTVCCGWTSRGVAIGDGRVYVGQIDGAMVALDAETGEVEWQHAVGDWKRGETITSAPLDLEGRIYTPGSPGGAPIWQTPAVDPELGLLSFSTGNSLAARPHGDNVWLFSLDGTLGPATEVGPGTGTGDGGQDGGATPESGDPASGEQVFADNCSSCHGADGQGGNGRPDLSRSSVSRTAEAVANKVRVGGKGMPAFEGVLTPNQINDVAAFVADAIATAP
jgi:outer membrane protein assembly factor BamB